jgi:FkbM family methyltransferase
MNKLEGFPSIYYLSLEESGDRRKFLHDQFSEYNIQNITPIISKRLKDCDDIIEGEYIHTLTDQSKGSLVSHIKALRQWLVETDDEYVFVCEDDVSFETVPYWGFTWKDFMNRLPENWEIVQLLVVRDNFENKFEFRSRIWDDWALAAYIIRRDYAQTLVDRYYIDGRYTLNVSKDNFSLQPIGENIVYIPSNHCYSVPLFVEEVYKFNTTLINENDFSGNKDGYEMVEGQGKSHITSYHEVLNFYKNNKISLKNMFDSSLNNKNLLENYIFDTENSQKNYDLARWYHEQGQTAAAITFYLRAADRTKDLTLAYECLLHTASCFRQQGNREYTVKSLYQKAVSILPNRPEAYFFLAKFDEYKKNYSDCYTTCNIALKISDFNLPSLHKDIDYPGKYGLLLEKAISAYWWGLGNESREILKDLLLNYEMSDEYIQNVKDNLKVLKIDISELVKNKDDEIKIIEQKKSNFQFSPSFDWGELSYEDIITIEREIINENVYGFDREIKENDIVMDIGASVGPFICSILDKKPQKIYCVEPSSNLIDILIKNCAEKTTSYKDNPLVYINKAIIDNETKKINIFGNNTEYESTTFKEMVEEYSIGRINFLKIDCEGGEYSIFIPENMDFLKNNVDYIAMEVHLKYENCRNKFKKFRDECLTKFDNYLAVSCTRQNIAWGKNIDLTDKILTDDFIDSYDCEFMIYIRNN